MFTNGEMKKSNGLNGNENGKTNGCNNKIQKNKSMENDYR